MKLMKDMTATEVIELIASVLLRIFAFSYAIAAFRNLCHFLRYLAHGKAALNTSETTSSYYIHGYIRDIAFDVFFSLIMFAWTAQLARLLTRGLAKALEPKPSVQAPLP